MEYNLYIFSFGSFLLIVFSTHMFFTNNGYTFLNKLLATLMLIRGLHILYFIAANTGQTLIISFLFKSLEPVIFLFSPFSYLYVRGFIMDENRFKTKDVFHIIPVIFAFINTIPWYFIEENIRANVYSSIIADGAFYYSENFGFISNQLTLLFQNGLLLIYTVFTWRMVIRYEIIKNRKFSKYISNWIIFFMVVISLTNLDLILNSFIYIGIGAKIANQLFANYSIFIQSTMLLVFFGYIFYNPKVLYGYVFVLKEYALPEKLTDLKAIHTEENDDLKELNETKSINSTSKEKTLNLSNEEIDQTKKQMVSLMENEKPFLNPDFSLGDLANEMCLPAYMCSRILNKYFGKNFREWVNAYRIDYFIETYPSLVASQTIVSIAMASGFKNKNTFYNAFEKVTGQTPSKYFDV